MKLSKDKLKQIIKEEVEKLLAETNWSPSLKEEAGEESKDKSQAWGSYTLDQLKAQQDLGAQKDPKWRAEMAARGHAGAIEDLTIGDLAIADTRSHFNLEEELMQELGPEDKDYAYQVSVKNNPNQQGHGPTPRGGESWIFEQNPKAKVEEAHPAWEKARELKGEIYYAPPEEEASSVSAIDARIERAQGGNIYKSIPEAIKQTILKILNETN